MFTWLLGKPIKTNARIKGVGADATEIPHPDIKSFDTTPTHLMGKDMLGRTVLVVPLIDVSLAIIERVDDGC